VQLKPATRDAVVVIVEPEDVLKRLSFVVDCCCCLSFVVACFISEESFNLKMRDKFCTQKEIKHE